MSSQNPSSLFSLNGKRAVVTGGAGWLGRPMVEALAGAGARVLIASRGAEQATSVIADLRDRGLEVTAATYDQGEEASIGQLFARSVELLGGVDILVNNAALWPMRSRSSPLADFARSMQVNATGLFGITRRFGEHMAEQGSGSIINIGSMFGMVGPDLSVYEGLSAESGLPDYFFHKGGMLQLTRYMAAIYGPRGVRVNTVSLGPFRKHQTEEMAGRFARRTMIKRMGTPSEVAGSVVFLASDASSYITGSNLVVDGGYTAH